MKLLVCVDENQNILSLDLIKKYKNALTEVQKLLQNKVVVCDDSYPDYSQFLPVCNKIVFDENKKTSLPSFLSPLSNSEEKYVSNVKELMYQLNRLNKNHVYVVGTKVIKKLFKDIEHIFQLNVMASVTEGPKLFELKTNPNWELVSYLDPIYDDKTISYFSHYKRKVFKKEKIQNMEIDF